MIGINLILTVMMGFGMASFGVDSIDLKGSLAYALAMGGCGLFFAALTMVVVQLNQSTRGAIGASMTILGVFYVVRAYGDVSSEAVALMSPLGIIQRSLPFYRDEWWPGLVLCGISVLLGVVAFVLNFRRDLGQGLLPQAHLRRAHAPRLLSDEWGLAWRLTRGTVFAWSLTVLILAMAYGSVMGEMEDFVKSSPIYEQMMGVGAGSTDIVGPVIAMLVMIMGLIGTIPILTTAYKITSEERKGRMDYILGKTVSRTRLFMGYALLAACTAVVMMILTAVGFYVVAVFVMTDSLSFTMVVKVAFNYGPALLAMGGLGLFITGWAKKAPWIGWGYLVVCFLAVYMGGMVDLPRWAQRLTPFGLLQRWPTESFSWWPWIGLVIAAIVLTAAGAVGFRRRDVTT